MWKLNNIRIFVTDKEHQAPQKTIAVLQPLNGGSIYHTFGYKKAVYSLKGKIVGDTDRQAIETLSQNGSTVTLSGYGRNFGNFLISSAKFSEDRTICQTLRPDLDPTSPVYSLDLELLYVN